VEIAEATSWQVSSGRSALRTVALLDTAAGSTNLGDEIIMDAVRREIRGLFPDAMIFAIATHERMGARSRRFIRRADWAISGGTSLLSSRMWYRPSWNVRPVDALARLDIVLMGAGWHQYQSAPDPYSRWMLGRLLSRNRLHSVRDDYTRRMLASIGISNAVNTGCPTMWGLTTTACARVPLRKATSVVATVNSYAGLKAPEADRRLLEVLKQHYRTVYLWIQTNTDYEYARSLQD
jgi:polysaccharide pyruvyl transferase WcaK-like protein